jgi:hypothetical protein
VSGRPFGNGHKNVPTGALDFGGGVCLMVALLGRQRDCNSTAKIRFPQINLCVPKLQLVIAARLARTAGFPAH